MEKKYVIFAASDERFGDFLINEWLTSLKDNVNLKSTDIVILDYGLTEAQKEQIKAKNARIYTGIRDGHVTIIRFRDMADILRNSNYTQVLSTDGGDIIFQDDFSSIWEYETEKFRCVYEDMEYGFSKIFSKGFFSKEREREILKTLQNNKTINAGVLFGPKDKFLALSEETYENTIKRDKFGPDQVYINYVLHRDRSFSLIDKTYNYVPATSKKLFKIKDNEFYLNGEKLKIIHNTGHFSFFRLVNNFGYGEGKNQVKFVKKILIRAIMKTLEFFT